MYTYKDKIYSDAGKYLSTNIACGFRFDINKQVTEHVLNIDDLYIINDYAYYNNGIFSIRIHQDWTYSDYKCYIIKLRYSNDDQIALMLNNGESIEDTELYNKMMQWREFASILAKKIISVKSE